MSVGLKNYRLWGLVIVLVLVTRGLFFISNLTKPLDLAGEGEVIVVASGATLQKVLKELEDREILAAAFDLRLYARLTGKGELIHAGEYLLEDSLDPLGLLDKLVAGNVVTHSITFPEGWTLLQALRAIRRHDALEHTLPEDSYDEVQSLLGLEFMPEGMIFPDTYLFTRGDTDTSILLRAHKLLTTKLEKAWEERDAGLPYDTPYEALVMASIVERETAVPSERGQIAGVFVRRLQVGMRLQTDPTVIYGLGTDYQGDITSAHLRQLTPYNTYMVNGLPPTPIALAGEQSILASLHPEPGSALYFVSRGDGSHQFSDTLEEHNAAVQRYQLNQTSESE